MTSDVQADRTEIIVDGGLLSCESIPDEPVGRDPSVAKLEVCLASMQRGHQPLNVWLSGPSGSGKTMLARWVVNHFCLGSTTRIGVYVNCWERRSLFSVAQAIIDDLRILGAEAQDTNLKLDRIRQALRGRPALVILDEIDRPMPSQRDAIIYGLLSLPKTGLICIANSTRALARLDERVRSRLSPVLIELPAYSAKQVEEILTHRAQRALMPGTWSPALIKRIADAVAGDARLAIDTLRQAAAAAEEAGRTTLESRFVQHNLRRWQAVRQEARLMTLSEHEKIIQKLAKRHAPIGTTRLRRLYVAYCRSRRIRPMARRTFSKYLSRLAAAGILNVAGRYAGSGGRLVRVA